MIYPIAEMFESFQGEGVYAGTMMTFIRLAGCNVGKPYHKSMYGPYEKESFLEGVTTTEKPLFPIYTEKCTLYDGREFPCDTDYRVTERLDDWAIAKRVRTHHVCITGGEPLIHDLQPLLTQLAFSAIHIETSGTVYPSFLSKPENHCYWITVSPKKNVLPEMLKRANEIKFLVDEKFDPCAEFNGWSPCYLASSTPTFLQPINFEHEINVKNLKLCREIQKQYTTFRISPQMHKMISYFLEERIR